MALYVSGITTKVGDSCWRATRVAASLSIALVGSDEEATRAESWGALANSPIGRRGKGGRAGMLFSLSSSSLCLSVCLSASVYRNADGCAKAPI